MISEERINTAIDTASRVRRVRMTLVSTAYDAVTMDVRPGERKIDNIPRTIEYLIDSARIAWYDHTVQVKGVLIDKLNVTIEVKEDEDPHGNDVAKDNHAPR